nr:unnamed protein product [Callosobruchus chinensis]
MMLLKIIASYLLNSMTSQRPLIMFNTTYYLKN